jgi:DNA-binding IclR family transcriptional regulator
MKRPREKTQPPERRAPDYAVQSVVRACEILAAFQTPEEVLQLRQVTAKAKLNKVTAFRLLSTLVSKGLIERVGKTGIVRVFSRCIPADTASATRPRAQSCLLSAR